MLSFAITDLWTLSCSLIHNMRYCYLIGGIGFDFSVEKDLIEYSPYDVFCVDRCDSAVDERHRFIFSEKNYILPIESKLISSNSSVDIYETENEYIHVNKRFDGEDYTCTVVSPKDRPGGTFYYSTGNFDKLKVTTELFRCCDLISSLLFYDAVIFHCSYIIYKGKAVLFSAPSEGGKSTQAELWKKYRGAEIINGDRAVLKKENDGWYVYSLPFCGSSGICKNKSAKLEAIAFLNKSENNSVENLLNSQKVSMIISQLTFENKKKTDFDKVIRLAEDLICTQRIIKLNCRIDKEATEVLKKEVFPDE